MIVSCINNAKSAINNIFNDKEPWQIVSITTFTVLSTVSIYNFINDDEGKLLNLIVNPDQFIIN